MNVAEYVVDFLIEHGVTHAFGIPGGVILELLYAMQDRKEELTPHLCYHEQGAAFAACGYAQSESRLAVTYATRGPGIVNTLTAVADAYYDSLPLMVLTAHEKILTGNSMRAEADQEMDPVPLFQSITKYAVRIDRLEDVKKEIHKAYDFATTGRKGPVLLDFQSGLFHQSILKTNQKPEADCLTSDGADACCCVLKYLKSARRPVFLIGDGIKQASMEKEFCNLADAWKIPVISSRAGHDIMAGSPYYFGFIGSHGMRYSNFVLSKTDCIISLGNRLSVPVESESFHSIFENARTVRIDIDEAEFLHEIPNSICFCADLKDLIPQLMRYTVDTAQYNEWRAVCTQLQKELKDMDAPPEIKELEAIMRRIPAEAVVVVDVGNHEFWASQAYVKAGISNKVLYSKSFGALGCAIPKAIGAYYSAYKPVICITGDQGFQINEQELQYIGKHRLPIEIIVLNNHCSGMIRSRQIQKFSGKVVHTTAESGYYAPNFKKIAEAFGFFYRYTDLKTEEMSIPEMLPMLNELQVDPKLDLQTWLPKGIPCQNLYPPLEREQYDVLNAL